MDAFDERFDWDPIMTWAMRILALDLRLLRGFHYRMLDLWLTDGEPIGSITVSRIPMGAATRLTFEVSVRGPIPTLALTVTQRRT